MDEQLEALEQAAKKTRNFDSPPLEKWHPELSGDIDIRIATDGSWFHQGEKIRREAIVKVFASILRREADGEYYLVTPAEKWRIQVDKHALIVTLVDRQDDSQDALVATLNTGKQVPINAEFPLFLDETMEGVAAIRLPHGLTALFSRAAWYRLVAIAEERDGTPVVVSSGQIFPLQ